MLASFLKFGHLLVPTLGEWRSVNLERYLFFVNVISENEFSHTNVPPKYIQMHHRNKSNIHNYARKASIKKNTCFWLSSVTFPLQAGSPTPAGGEHLRVAVNN